MEAFSKFGSDLDAATKLTIEKGRRNVEILKQAQYSPVPVEQQVAIIYVSTNGLIDNVPVNKVKDLKMNSLGLLKAQHKETLEAIRAGKIDDSLLLFLKKQLRILLKNT